MQWCQCLEDDYGMDPWIWQSLDGLSLRLWYVVASFLLTSKNVFNFFLYSFLDQGITEKTFVHFQRECWLSIIYVVIEDQSA